MGKHIIMDNAALNAKLEGASYLNGHMVSTADFAQFESMAGPPSASTPHAARWYKHISSFSLGERLRVRSAGVSAAAAAPAAAAASSQAAPAAAGSDDKKLTKAEKKAA